MLKEITVLENVSEDEMKIAIRAIERARSEKAREQQAEALERQLMATIKELNEIGYKVRLRGGGYVHSGDEINTDTYSSIYVSRSRYI